MTNEELEQLRKLSPQLYESFIKEKQQLEEQKNNFLKSKYQDIFSQRNFPKYCCEKLGTDSIIQYLESCLKSYLVSNLHEEGFRDLDEDFQVLSSKRLLNYLTKFIVTPDKIKKSNKKQKQEQTQVLNLGE